MNKASLTLVLPDSAALLANELNRPLLPEQLRRILDKARFLPDQGGYFQHLSRLFTPPAERVTNLPVAQLRGGSQNSLCADPCYLHADRDKLLMFYQDLDISSSEAELLVQRLQPLFDDMGAKLTVQNADQWLLEITDTTKAEFTSPEGLHGRAVTDCLPKGMDAAGWIRLWNEIQMVLFECPENQAREAAGKVPVNSVWFWGEGEMQPWLVWQHVSGKEPILKALAEQSHSSYSSETRRYSDLKQTPAIHVEQIDLAHDWEHQLNLLTERWLEPAYSALSKWQLRELNIIVPEWGHYRLSPFSSWRFWK